MGKQKSIKSLLLYIATIFALSYFGFNPDNRSWGLNIWGYHSTLYIVSLCTFFVILGTALFYWQDKLPLKFSYLKYKTILTLITFGSILSFILFRVKTYFLGDGYTLLSALTKYHTIIEKKREIFASFVQVYLFRFLGGNSMDDAIASYQITSFISGLFFIACCTYTSNKLFSDYTKRIIFSLGMITGGYMLLYFGYVENYALFTSFILLYCILGLLILEEKSHKWILLILIPFGLGLHIFATALIPPSLYIVYSGSKLEKFFKNQNNIYLDMTLFIIFASFILLIIYFYNTNYFFKFSLVPFYETQITQEGYTLFSTNHLTDYLNLLFLLVPGILLLIFQLIKLRIQSFYTNKKYLFLLIFSISSLGIAFIFDPKLGMPRDWDLFAFCGIPIMFFFYYCILKESKLEKKIVTTLLLSIFISTAVLIPRAYSLTNDKMSILHFRNYLNIDKVKNRNSWILLVEYYKNQGDSLMADNTYSEWKSRFPEEKMLQEVYDLYAKDKNSKVVEEISQNILKINPIFPDVYTFLGIYYTFHHQLDTAITLFTISDALSPDRAFNLFHLGKAYYNKKDFKNSILSFKKATYLEPDNYRYAINLALVYFQLEDDENYIKHLLIASNCSNAPEEVFKFLIDYYLIKSNFIAVEQIFKEHPAINNDTVFINTINKIYNLGL